MQLRSDGALVPVLKHTYPLVVVRTVNNDQNAFDIAVQFFRFLHLGFRNSYRCAHRFAPSGKAEKFLYAFKRSYAFVR
jgi:hypothetical protein